MIYLLSRLDCKQERSFAKWIEERVKEVDSIVREKLTMDRRGLDYEKEKLRSFVKVYKTLKKLHKIDDNFDIKLIITNKGYVSFVLYYSMTRAEEELARKKYRDAVDSLNKDGFRWGSACVRIDEKRWMVMKDKVMKHFKPINPLPQEVTFVVNWSR